MESPQQDSTIGYITLPSSTCLTVTAFISTSKGPIKVKALVDTGATGYAYIDQDFVQKHNLIKKPLIEPINLRMFNGEIAIENTIQEETKIDLSIEGLSGDIIVKHYDYKLQSMITKLGTYPLVLGIGWLRRHEPGITWRTNKLEFISTYCQEDCLRVREASLSAYEAPKNLSIREDCLRDKESTLLAFEALKNLSIRDKSIQSIDYPQSKSDQFIDHSRSKSIQSTGLLESRSDQFTGSKLDIAIISAAAYNLLAKKPENQIFSATIEDIKKALRVKEYVDPLPLLPKEYHEFVDVFSRGDSDVLPPHRPYDHRVPVQEDAKLPFSRLYSMSQNELEVLKKYLDDNLRKGFISPSSSPVASPVLFVKKPGGGLRLCVDYRALNALTTKNQYPLPLIRETLSRLSKARFFTKLDVIAAFNRIRMAKGDEYLTAFRTRYGLFQYNVMPFGLTGAPSTFQHYINDTLREFLDVFATAYLDDILIYSESIEEHRQHVRQVLTRLRMAGLQIDIEKCEFHTQETRYLGLIIGTDGVKMDPKKIEAIRDWKPPNKDKDKDKIKEVQAFLGFANFYRRFISGFSTIVKPLTELTKKGKVFDWDDACTTAFKTLIERFISAPILKWFDPDLEIMVETDASDYVSAGVLSQLHPDGIWHPVAYFSKKHSPEECNYEIYDKELLAIIRSLEEWRPELEGAKFPVKILSDHKNLEYFMSTKLLNRRQARWSEFLSRFQFKISYRPGKQGQKPDALTRRSGDLPKEGDQRLDQQAQLVLKPEMLEKEVLEEHIQSTDSTESTGSTEFTGQNQEDFPVLRQYGKVQEVLPLDDLFTKGYQEDKNIGTILSCLRTGKSQSKLISLAECSELDGKLYYQGKRYVPDHEPLKIELLKRYHDSPLAGHPGSAKTLELISRDYYWPQLYLFVKRYIRNCRICARIKSSNTVSQGVLRPLPIPERPWNDIAMDFIVGLPLSQGYDAILNVNDRLTGMRHLIPCTKETGSEDLAWLYLKEVFRLHGLPLSIISDRGPQFISEFWKALMKRLKIDVKLSTAFHPQTDGKSERINAITEQYIRAYCSYLQDDWVDWLPIAEFCGNSGYSEPIKTNAFLANYGYNPRMGFESITTPKDRPQVVNAAVFINRIHQIHDYIGTQIKEAQLHQETYKNRHRIPAPNYKKGDLVYLSTRNLRTQRPSQKLDWKHIGPYPIEEVISPYAYKLKLPATARIHPVFHTSLLSLSADDPYKDQVQEPPPPVEIEGKEEFEVEDIVDSLIKRKKLYYKVKWVGYDAPTTEPYEFVKHLKNLLKKFHRAYPIKPKPIRF